MKLFSSSDKSLEPSPNDCLCCLLATKGLKLQEKYKQLDKYSVEEQIKILDKLGDVFSKGKAFDKSLSYYKKEVCGNLLYYGWFYLEP